MKKYIKKDDPSLYIVAVQLNLEIDCLEYEKWGSTQTAKQGDWLVNSGGECYSIDAESFAATYQEVSPGQFRKVAPVWAAAMVEAGNVATKEGATEYSDGDYLVCNNENGKDTYAVSKAKFEAMYEAA